jgi:hypothetical protein
MDKDAAPNVDDLVKAILATHESVMSLLAIFIPILAALFVAFQNAANTVEVLGTKFTPGQGAAISVILIVVACYFCARNFFVLCDLLDQVQDKSFIRRMLQVSAAPLNPFTEVSPPFAGKIFNYSGIVLMHIAPIGVVIGFSDLIVAAQRSFMLATFHFVLVLLFAVIYFSFYVGLASVINIVNPNDAGLRLRILRITIFVLVVAFLVYGYIANLENSGKRYKI